MLYTKVGWSKWVSWALSSQPRTSLRLVSIWVKAFSCSAFLAALSYAQKQALTFASPKYKYNDIYFNLSLIISDNFANLNGDLFITAIKNEWKERTEKATTVVYTKKLKQFSATWHKNFQQSSKLKWSCHNFIRKLITTEMFPAAFTNTEHKISLEMCSKFHWKEICWTSCLLNTDIAR